MVEAKVVGEKIILDYGQAIQNGSAQIALSLSLKNIIESGDTQVKTDGWRGY